MSRFTIIFDALVRRGDAVIGKRRTYLGLAGLVAACMFAQPSFAVIVGTCKSGVQFTTIQAAVLAAPQGGTVSICPGTYAEQVTITRSVSLVGLTIGTSDQIIIASPSGGVVQNTTDLYTGGGAVGSGQGIAAQILITPPSGKPAPIVNLSNLIVDGTNNQITGCAPDLMGIFYENASGTVNHVVARNQALSPPASLNGCQSGQGIYVESGYSVFGTATVTIEYSSVHGYQKNGITADGAGTTFTITGNDVVGQGPTSGAAENGIQVSDGAQGTVYNNRIVDDIWTGGGEASGIIVYDTGGLTIQANTVSDTQYGIVVYTDGTVYDPNNSYTDANNNTIKGNQVSATHINDGIDLCSDGNKATGNTVVSSDSSGIHIDSTCTDSEGNTTGNGSTVTGNTVIEACAGVLLGNGTGNTTSPANAAYDVIDTTYAGDTCPAGVGAAAKRATKPSPHVMR
jgi:hypothetical protein